MEGRHPPSGAGPVRALGSDDADVLRLGALLALGDVELHALALLQFAVALTGDVAVVGEDVRAAALLRDEGQDGRTVPPVVMTRWQWYKAACARHRWRYMVTELLGLVSAAAVPVAVAMRLGSSVIAVLGAIVVVASGTRVLFGSHDAWVEFSASGVERWATRRVAAISPVDSGGV